jgi:hypothetical protein
MLRAEELKGRGVRRVEPESGLSGYHKESLVSALYHPPILGILFNLFVDLRL